MAAQISTAKRNMSLAINKAKATNSPDDWKNVGRASALLTELQQEVK